MSESTAQAPSEPLRQLLLYGLQSLTRNSRPQSRANVYQIFREDRGPFLSDQNVRFCSIVRILQKGTLLDSLSCSFCFPRLDNPSPRLGHRANRIIGSQYRFPPGEVHLWVSAERKYGCALA